MNDDLRSPNDPRWGQEGRAAKAEAIARTLRWRCDGELPRGLWLDVGCGSGGIAAALAPFADRVVGVDPESWERWQAFRDRDPNLDFRKGGYRDLASLVGSGSCDVIICNQVYEHVDDPEALLQSIHAT
jgi:2-polyprenyl-3-methyl-5-hydroxy-6-metoxy-1,4-benzoquinol methylase